MKKCKHCQSEIPKKATVCLHCKGKQPKHYGLGTLIIPMFIIGFVLSTLNDDGTYNPPPKNTATKAHKASVEKCPLKIENLGCFAKKHRFDAAIACEIVIEDRAAYAHKWTATHTRDLFPYNIWLDIEEDGLTPTGITYSGKQLQLQNGYGAWQKVTYWCDYDFVNERVLDVRVE